MDRPIRSGTLDCYRGSSIGQRIDVDGGRIEIDVIFRIGDFEPPRIFLIHLDGEDRLIAIDLAHVGFAVLGMQHCAGERFVRTNMNLGGGTSEGGDLGSPDVKRGHFCVNRQGHAAGNGKNPRWVIWPHLINRAFEFFGNDLVLKRLLDLEEIHLIGGCGTFVGEHFKCLRLTARFQQVERGHRVLLVEPLAVDHCLDLERTPARNLNIARRDFEAFDRRVDIEKHQITRHGDADAVESAEQQWHDDGVDDGQEQDNEKWENDRQNGKPEIAGR